MSKDYVVLFEKSKEYQRFHATGIFTNLNKNMFAIDLFEETPPMLKKFIVGKDGETSSENEQECDLKNYVHATVLIAPENLPLIIDSMQTLYARYQQGKLSQTGE